MKAIKIITVIATTMWLFLTGQGVNPNGFTLTSSAFSEGDSIPSEYACEGIDISPQLKWENAPGGTKSFTITCLDPDAPPGTWVHWIIYDLPGDLMELEQRLPKTELLANGAKQGSCWGVNSFSRVGYYGPCPPTGHGFHRYFFTLYALDIETLSLAPKATLKEVLTAMEGHILGKAVLMGKYKRD